MSCNITSGIAKGCNDQVGGITAIYYMEHPDIPVIGAPPGGLFVNRDSNGIITRISPTNFSNPSWNYIDCSNIQGSVTETINVNTNGSILGFHQSAQFFMPMTANMNEQRADSSAPQGTQHEFLDALAKQNNLIIGIVTSDNSPLKAYSDKCFVFGLKRPAYCASGSKETGITYNDNNGYTIELAADSKEPMQEIAYMAFQGWHQCFKHNAPGVSDNTWDNLDYFGLNPLIEYEGANISTVGTANYGHPDIYVMPGETLTVEGILSIDWGANAFSGSTFLPEWGIGLTGIPLTYDTSILPLPTVPGLQTVYLKGAYTNNSGGIQQVTPVKLTSPIGVNISGMSTTPYFLFSTITRTS